VQRDGAHGQRRAGRQPVANRRLPVVGVVAIEPRGRADDREPCRLEAVTGALEVKGVGHQRDAAHAVRLEQPRSEPAVLPRGVAGRLGDDGPQPNSVSSTWVASTARESRPRRAHRRSRRSAGRCGGQPGTIAQALHAQRRQGLGGTELPGRAYPPRQGDDDRLRPGGPYLLGVFTVSDCRGCMSSAATRGVLRR